MKYEDKFQGCLAGIALGEALGNGYPNWARPGLYSSLANVVEDSLILKGSDPKDFITAYKQNMSSWYEAAQSECSGVLDINQIIMGDQAGPFAFDPSIAVRALPVGLYWMDNIPMVVEYSLSMAQTTHPATLAMCSAVAGGLLVTMAAQDVPTGLWGHEILSVINGIDKYFTESLKRATSLAAARTPPNIAFTPNRIGIGKTAHEVIMGVLYSAMLFPYNPNQVIRAAAMMPENRSAAAAIAGACMGAVHGIGIIEKLLPADIEWTLEKEKEQGTRMWAVGAERIKKNVIRHNGLG